MSTVELAERRVKALLSREMGPGMTQEAAMHRVEAKFGVPFWTQWSLLYRKPKKIAADILNRLEQAGIVSAEQALRREIAEIKVEIAKDRGTDLEGLLAEAEGLLAQIKKAREAA